MANTFNQPFSNPAFLNSNQQDLLMAALSSNSGAVSNVNQQSNRNSLDFTGSLDPSMLANTDFNGMYQDFEFDPQFLDSLDSNGQPVDYDYDDDDSPDGDVNPTDLESHNDHGEKRKSMAGGKDDGEGSSKRREGDEKQAKKPGRKPLTSEPTSKRKAQNRAAQRAFRERKERHLKDLETKVEELEKTSESTTHENGLLRAQVERLQTELREYRKRLSNQSTIGRSPPSTLNSYSSVAANNAINAFNFDMPRFGSQSSTFDSSTMFGSNPLQMSPQATSLDFNSSNGLLSRHTSTDGMSPFSNFVNTPATSDSRSQHGSLSQDSPRQSNENNGYANDIFSFGKVRNTSVARGSSDSPGVYNIFSSPTTVEPTDKLPTPTESQNGSRVFQFNPTSSASPSDSSSSHYGGNGPSSSCGTSPEPTTSANKEPTLSTIDEDAKKKEFMEAMGSTCGSKSNPTPVASIENTETRTLSSEPFIISPSPFDMFSASLPIFPDSSVNLQSDNGFSGGFFNDNASTFDFSSPMNWNDLTGSMRTGLTPGVQKPNPFDATFDASLPGIKEEVVPADKQTIPCNKIWDAIQQRPEYRDGNIDIDGLCTELRKKAKCSENGVVVDKHDVDAALQRLPGLPGMRT